MSYVGEMIKHAECGRTYTTCATPDELYDAWNASGRGLTHDIVVLPSLHAGDALEFTIKPVELGECDQYTGDVLQVAVTLAGIMCVGFILIGWGLS